jgi:hypothetical protein
MYTTLFCSNKITHRFFFACNNSLTVQIIYFILPPAITQYDLLFDSNLSRRIKKYSILAIQFVMQLKNKVKSYNLMFVVAIIMSVVDLKTLRTIIDELIGLFVIISVFETFFLFVSMSFRRKMKY